MDIKHTVGRPVDLVDRFAVERRRNYLRRRQILLEAEPVYLRDEILCWICRPDYTKTLWRARNFPPTIGHMGAMHVYLP